ncbi:hypothetical protein [Nocardia bhagyanarayanae]|uniref:hypothetical protein n=1 Tax=Nocardia bhagyanarayanae TaxID=1215925 RepID=UPI00114FDE04|nr:hypothetical protein [Nocardia bhagyanarayanae]
MAASLWSRRPWNPNPLLRPGDRLDITLRVFAVLAGLLAVPIAGALATTTYADGARQVAAQRAVVSQAEALVITEPVQTGPARWEASVRWTARSAAVNARIVVPRNVSRGQYRTVWIGPDGTPIEEPRRVA